MDFLTSIKNVLIAFMNFLADKVNVINTLMWSRVLIVLLIGVGIYFSFRTKFVQFRFFKEMFRLLMPDDKKNKDGVSSFQAFCISTASRVGTGNIAGVAMAVAAGGPGSVFWMWLIALIGGASSFVESTLAQIYKTKDKDGNFLGGPAYYIERGLGKRWLGIIFAILTTLCFGLVFNAAQSNTTTLAFTNAFGINPAVMGIILSVLTALVIFGGVKRIAKVSEVIVPIFATAYILIAIIVIVLNFKTIPSIFVLIFENAFGIKEFAAGGLGFTIMQGIKRGLFSNEAGMGSAPNAAATATVSHPVKQGLTQTLGVFTDTIVICTCTAFIVLISGDYAGTTLTGIELTQTALTSQIGVVGTYFLAICTFLFAFSSIVGNYYYGQTNIEFISDNKAILNIFRSFVVFTVFIGSLASIDLVWNLADLFMAFMAVINLIAILFLGKYAFAALEDYSRQKKAGKDPIFKASTIPGLENTEAWEDNNDHTEEIA
ncbi:alanine/glycine:cation symporter family protein [Clostridium subterminale]|uniref:Alanine/glycine:cation symporter family protein n=2 Tax=Clostridium subterminale TaxID=1550 RepID=A0ABN1KQD1_CLOSU